MDYILHKTDNGYLLTNTQNPTIDDITFKNNKIIASDFVIPCSDDNILDLNLSELSDDEQKTIGWFDINKLFTNEQNTLEFIRGFKKHKELTSDLKFNLNDMIDFATKFQKEYNKEYVGNANAFIHEYILEKNSWNVEIETECVGISKIGESCRKNNNCKYPDCGSGSIKVKRLC